MAATRARGAGVKQTVTKVLGVILAIGLLMALLRVFNWDPFGVIDWIWSWFLKVVTSIADALTGAEWFRKATSKPA